MVINNVLEMTMNEAKPGPRLYAVARIGRSGTKLHPVIVDVDGYANFVCSCTGTANGHAYNNCTIFVGSGWKRRTCGKKG